MLIFYLWNFSAFCFSFTYRKHYCIYLYFNSRLSKNPNSTQRLLVFECRKATYVWVGCRKSDIRLSACSYSNVGKRFTLESVNEKSDIRSRQKADSSRIELFCTSLVKTVQSDQKSKYQLVAFAPPYFGMRAIFYSSITLRKEESSIANIIWRYCYVWSKKLRKKDPEWRR